jgi:predicted anti-sigma-YlaC factor YlaD
LEQLADYLEPDAREELCRAIEQHLSTCSGCRVEVDTVKRTIVLYQADREVQMPAQVQSKLAVALAQEYNARRESSD